MLDETLVGIDILDASEPFYKRTEPTKILGYISLRKLLLKYVKLGDGSPAFAEVHQAGPLSAVTVVYPNIEEAETLVVKMNKNIAAFLIFTLQEEGLPEELLKRIMKASCDADTYVTALACQWDDEYKTVLLPKEKVGDEARKDEQEKEEWYFEEFGVHMKEKAKQKEKAPYIQKEDMFDLDTVGSVKTIHDNHLQRAARAAKAAKELSSDEEDEEVEVRDRRKTDKKKTTRKKSKKNTVIDIDEESSEDSEDSVADKKGKKKKKNHKDSASKHRRAKSRTSKNSRETIELSSSDSSSSTSTSSAESDSEDDGAGSG